jgi:hypothetical protein
MSGPGADLAPAKRKLIQINRKDRKQVTDRKQVKKTGDRRKQVTEENRKKTGDRQDDYLHIHSS